VTELRRAPMIIPEQTVKEAFQVYLRTREPSALAVVAFSPASPQLRAVLLPLR